MPALNRENLKDEVSPKPRPRLGISGWAAAGPATARRACDVCGNDHIALVTIQARACDCGCDCLLRLCAVCIQTAGDIFRGACLEALERELAAFVGKP